LADLVAGGFLVPDVGKDETSNDAEKASKLNQATNAENKNKKQEGLSSLVERLRRSLIFVFSWSLSVLHL